MTYLFFVPAAYRDFKEKQIPLTVIMIGIGLGIFKMTEGLFKNGPIYLVGLIPGLILLMAYVITEGKIGVGDGIALLILGAMEGYRVCAITTIISTGLIFAFCVGGMILKKLTRNTRVPFIPFLLSGLIIVKLAGI